MRGHGELNCTTLLGNRVIGNRSEDSAHFLKRLKIETPCDWSFSFQVLFLEKAETWQRHKHSSILLQHYLHLAESKAPKSSREDGWIQKLFHIPTVTWLSQRK